MHRLISTLLTIKVSCRHSYTTKPNLEICSLNSLQLSRSIPFITIVNYSHSGQIFTLAD
jgi:hypothetical protein